MASALAAVIPQILGNAAVVTIPMVFGVLSTVNATVPLPGAIVL